MEDDFPNNLKRELNEVFEGPWVAPRPNREIIVVDLVLGESVDVSRARIRVGSLQDKVGEVPAQDYMELFL